MFNRITQLVNKLTGKDQANIQVLLDREKVKMLKTSEYTASDHGDKTSFTYKFLFDNLSRKRRFLAAINKYPPQEWDPWVRWMDEVTVLNGEFITEAQCLVPPDEVGRFRFNFENFVTKKLILEN